jgi:hypothetical protein
VAAFFSMLALDYSASGTANDDNDQQRQRRRETMSQSINYWKTGQLWGQSGHSNGDEEGSNQRGLFATDIEKRSCLRQTSTPKSGAIVADEYPSLGPMANQAVSH